MTTHKFCIRVRELVTQIVLLFAFVCCFDSIYAQSSDISSLDRGRKELASLNLSSEVESRLGHALNVYEKMVQGGRYISSIAELIKDKEMSLPVGLKSDKYVVCIEELYEDSLSDGQKRYIKAICKIPISDKNSLAFEGVVSVEGENGVDTQGLLTLIAPTEKALGGEGSLIFREGSTLAFDCYGFKEVDACLAFILKTDEIYGIDDNGRKTGMLMFDTRTKFVDLDDFVVTINCNQRFCIDGLDDFLFTLNNLILDHSLYSTPTITTFPTDYFQNADIDESRKNWQGLAISKASVELPIYMSKDSENAKKIRMSLMLRNVLIDGNGLTCSAEAKDVVSDSHIDPQSWSMSINDFVLSIAKSTIQKAGFGGKVNIPPLGKSSMLDYTACYDVERRTFVLQSSLGSDLDFPMLCAKLTLDKNSTIELKVTDNGVNPIINANGLISINAPVGKDTADSKLVLPDLRFEGMVISPDKFELGKTSLTGEFATPSLAGFKLTLNNVETVNNGETQGLKVDAAVAISNMFNGQAGIALYGDVKKCKFSNVDVDKINVGYKSNAFSLEGDVEFKDGDEIYGKGFRGNLELKVIKKFNFKAVGVFGHKDEYRYFLTDVLYTTDPVSGIQVPPALTFYGFGGGLYNHMRQTSNSSQSEFGKSLSGICYMPDKEVGMGFLARTKFAMISSPTLLDADVNLEMQFNNNWGVNFVQLRGEAKMLSSVQQSSLIDGIKRGLEQVEMKSGNIMQFNKKSLEVKPKDESALSMTVGMKYDIENEVFTSDMNVYLDVIGVLKGRGDNNRMGWASAYFAKDKWYTYIGTPQSRLGVSLLGIADAGGYFMVGNDIPELSALPAQVKNNLSADYVERLEQRKDEDKLLKGSGLAFGSDLSVELDATLRPFYAHLGIGMGTEMLLKKYSEAVHCKGSTGSIGIDGWYAQAQAWAWVDAAIGMKVKLFKKERKFDILSGQMASVLKGAGPNPFYFTGVVGGKFNILNGLIKGHCSFDFTIGEKCEITGGSPFGEDVIAQLTPADKTTDVNVFVAPQLVLNIPADEKMSVEDDDGRKETYRVNIEEFSVQNSQTGAKLQYITTKSEDGRVWTYDLDEPLESHKDYKIYAKVAFERYDGDKWVAVSDENGKPYYEDKTISFTSGERPKYIMPEHVVYAYPADRQYNFLPKEYEGAYVMVSKDYSYLFTTEKPEGYDQKVLFSTFDGMTFEAPFSYKNESEVEGVKFEIDIPISNFNFTNDQIYNMSLVNIPSRIATADENIVTTETKLEVSGKSDVVESIHSAEGDIAMLERTEIYSIDFRTSSYMTFEEKMAGMEMDDIITLKLYSNVNNLKTNYIESNTNAEALDEYEYNIYDRENNLVVIEPIYSKTPWYTKEVAPLVYDNTDIENIIGEIAPPLSKDVVCIYTVNENVRLTDNIQTTNGRLALSRWHTINNNMQKYIDDDLSGYRTKVANGLTKGRVKTEGVSKFMLLNNIPETTYGEYPVVIKYIIPGRGITTSEIELNLYYKQNND